MSPILNKDSENPLRVNKNQSRSTTKAVTKRQNQRYLYQEWEITNNLNLEHKKCRKVLKCYGNVWVSSGKIAVFHNM